LSTACSTSVRPSSTTPAFGRPSLRPAPPARMIPPRLTEAGSEAGSRAEDRRQLLGHDDLELRVGARARLTLGAPAAEVGRVAEARSLKVVEGHLDDELGPQRLPCEVAAGVPAAGGAGHALALRPLLLGFGPARPRVALERV